MINHRAFDYCIFALKAALTTKPLLTLTPLWLKLLATQCYGDCSVVLLACWLDVSIFIISIRVKFFCNWLFFIKSPALITA